MGEFKKKPNLDTLRGIPAYIKMVEDAINTLLSFKTKPHPNRMPIRYPSQKDPQESRR
jgi:hypothetical protein